MVKPCKRRTKIENDSSLDTNTNNTVTIPMDIVKEILQRLPAKSIARFVRVSKSWANMIRSKYFINSFMEFQTQQQPHRLLFTFNKICDVNWRFFSSLLVSVATTVHEKPPPVEYISRMNSKLDGYSCSPIYVKGLVNFMFGRTHIISNPSTGKSIVLPDVKSRREILILRRQFGFDPIKAEYKVLCIIDCGHRNGTRITSSQYQVLTVGSKSSLWREIESWLPHRPISKGICIDGIIYYLASETVEASEAILVRFDVSSEKFLNQLPCSFLKRCTFALINYKSKLAIRHKTNERPIDLWVLEDVEKPKWCKITHDVSQWRSLVNGFDFEILGTTPSGEIVYTCYGGKNSSYVIYQDREKNQHRIVPIKAEKDCNSTSFVAVNGFIDYVESVMLL